MSSEEEGLGLDEFLDYDPDAQRGSGESKWLPKWKDGGFIDIFLHTESKIRPVHGHQIPCEIEADQKNQAGEKTGKKEPRLTWPRFTSPDMPNIHANQFFYGDGVLREQFNRDKNKKLIGGSNETAYMRDPFLILREYLRHAVMKKILDVDTVVFEWVNTKKKGELISWTVGELSRMEKRGFANRGHSLDTKLEYIFVVVDYNKPEEGPKIARETKMVGEKMRDEIKKQIESRGEDGDPFTKPYCFRWKFDKDKPPANMYDVYRMDKNGCTTEVWRAIGGAPDPDAGEAWDIVESIDTSEFARVNDGDMEKIRQIFENAAQITLPLNEIFSEDWKVRQSVVTGAMFSTDRPAASSSSNQQASRPNPGAAPGAQRPAVRANAGSNPAPTPGAQRPTQSAASAPQSAPQGEPQSRRKKKADDPVAPPPVELIKCEGHDATPTSAAIECDYMLRPDEEKCPKCGAEYDIPPPPTPAPKGDPTPGTSAQNQQPKRPSATASPESDLKCIACGNKRIEPVVTKEGTVMKCASCGCDQGDLIPF